MLFHCVSQQLYYRVNSFSRTQVVKLGTLKITLKAELTLKNKSIVQYLKPKQFMKLSMQCIKKHGQLYV